MKVQAMYAWHAKKANHLTFAKGDVISKLSEQNTWCYGEFKGEVGGGLVVGWWWVGGGLVVG